MGTPEQGGLPGVGEEIWAESDPGERPWWDTHRLPHCQNRDGDMEVSATERAHGSVEQHLTASLPPEKREPPPAAPIPRSLDLPEQPSTSYRRPVIDGRALASGAGLEEDDDAPF